MHIKLNKYEVRNILLVNLDRIFQDIGNLAPLNPGEKAKATNRPEGHVLAKIQIQNSAPGESAKDPIYFYARKSLEAESLFSGKLYFVEMFDWQDSADDGPFLFSSEKLSLLYLESSDGERLTCCVPKREVESLVASLSGESSDERLSRFFKKVADKLSDIQEKVFGHGRRKF